MAMLNNQRVLLFQVLKIGLESLIALSCNLVWRYMMYV